MKKGSGGISDFMASPFHVIEREVRRMDFAVNIVMNLALIVIAGLTGIGYIQWIGWKKYEGFIDYSMQYMKLEQEEQEKWIQEERQKVKEQEDKLLPLDIILKHGNSIGAYSAVNEDGSRKKGILSLNQIKLYGQSQVGRDYSYFIDEPEVEIWASDREGEVILRSSTAQFEIRQEGTPRDKGIKSQSIRLKKGIWYYVILESKHEIKIQAVEGI